MFARVMGKFNRSETLYFKRCGCGKEQLGTREELQVSPNPTTGMVTVQLPEELFMKGAQCQLFDLTGRLLGSQPVTSVATTLSLEAFPAGVYILKVTDNQSVLNTTKIIKQ